MAEIAIVGACLFDSIELFDKNKLGAIDIIGARVDYAVGGAGFNAAVALREVGHSIRFICPSVMNSLSDVVVRQALLANRISQKWLFNDESGRTNNGGLVAIKEAGLPQIAVTSTAYDVVPLTEDCIKKSIAGVDAVVIDSNLRVDQIQDILLSVSKLKNIPVFGLVVSDSKSDRFGEAARKCGLQKPFDLIAMNSKEASGILGDITLSSDSLLDFSTKVLCMSEGEKGVRLIQDTGIKNFPAYVSEIVAGNELGAGDAMFAGLCDYYLKHSSFEAEQAYNHARTFVVPVLNFRTATKNAALISIMRRGQSRPKLLAFLTVIFVLLSLLSLGSIALLAKETAMQNFMSYILLAGSSGVSGGLTATVIHFGDTDDIGPSLNTLLTNITLSFIAGLMVFVAYSVPRLVGGALPTNGESGSNIAFMLMVLFVSFGAGFAAKKVLANNFGQPKL